MYAENRATHNWLGMSLVNAHVRNWLPSICGRVLDLGCGTRPFESDIMCYADEYVGVDWDNSLHECKPDIEANLNNPLPIESSSFDHIVSFEVLEHLCEPEVMLKETFRVLKSGGEIVITVPFQWRIHEPPWDYFRYTRYGIEHLLSKSGFLKINISVISGFWTTIVLKCNYQLLRLVRGSTLRRKVSRIFLVPFWYASQHMALLLDRLAPDERETVGYFIKARKP